MLTPSPRRRAFRLALIGAMLCPNPGYARTIRDIDLGTIQVIVRPRIDACLIGNGSVSLQAPGQGQPGNSPAIDPSPVFHSGNTDLSAWGLGWTSDIDHFIELNATGSITWTDGSGTHTTYYRVAGSTNPPVFTPPINAYETITTVSASSGVPTSLLERDKDGTTRRFDVFESTGILRLARLTDSNGNFIDYTRDGQGRLTHVDDVHGRTYDLTYNAAALVATLSDSGGRSSSYAYDAQKRRTTDTGPFGTTAYQYDASNRMTRITYPNGGVKNYAYDASNRVTHEDSGSGQGALDYAYYKSSTTITDALGRVAKYDHIALRGLKKLAKATDPSGGVTTYAYDANLNLTSVTDPLGRVTAYAYDARGNITRTDDAAGGHAYAVYESTFNLTTSLTDPLAHATAFGYDNKGNQILTTDALLGTVAKAYDAQGHVSALTDPLSHSTLFTYEPSNGALKTVTDPLSRQTLMATDGLSRVTQNTDPASKVTSYQYDTASDLTRVQDALGAVTVYGYAAGRDKKLLATVTDAKNHTTSFGYDVQGRLTSVTNALGQTKTSQYDAKGNLTQTKNARNQTITYEYNSRDLLTKKTTPEGQITYGYDAAGNMTSMSHYNGSALAMTYDALNRVTQVVQTLPGGFSATIGYGYDAAGNRTSMTTPWGSFSYAYDALNRLTRITNPQGRQFNFQYDAAGRRTRLDYPNGIRTTYGYDSAGQVLSIIHAKTSDNTVIAKSTYTYDQAGNRLTMTDLAGTHSYGYDDGHRLVSASHPDASALEVKNESFAYDLVGNRTSDAQITGYTYDDANRLVENSSFTYTFDADGNRTAQQDKLTSGTTSFSFNSENQLVGANNAKGENWVYKYDRPGHRVEKSSGTATSQKQRFVYDGDNILAILDGANNPIQVFTMGLGIDEALSMRRSDASERYFHTDALGSVRALSNNSANLTETYEYLGYGLTVAANAIGNPIELAARESPLLYTGKIYDDETGLQHSNNRPLDQQAGIFTSEDPLGISGGDVNLYSYVLNRPTIANDPRGTQIMPLPLPVLPPRSQELPVTQFSAAAEIEIPDNRRACSGKNVPEATVRCGRVGGLLPVGNPPRCEYVCKYRGQSKVVFRSPNNWGFCELWIHETVTLN